MQLVTDPNPILTRQTKSNKTPKFFKEPKINRYSLTYQHRGWPRTISDTRCTQTILWSLQQCLYKRNWFSNPFQVSRPWHRDIEHMEQHRSWCQHQHCRSAHIWKNIVQNRVVMKILRRFDAFLGHNRFLLSDVRFIGLLLYNRFFNYPFPFMIDSYRVTRDL